MVLVEVGNITINSGGISETIAILLFVMIIKQIKK